MLRRRRSLSRRMRALTIVYAYAYRRVGASLSGPAHFTDPTVCGMGKRIAAGLSDSPPNPPFRAT